MSEYVSQLTPTLFWDVARDQIDDVKHRRFVIGRVLERGNLNDWRLTKDHYTLPVIVSEAQRIRSLEPKALSFIACVGGVDRGSFRCSTLKPSHQKHWIY